MKKTSEQMQAEFLATHKITRTIVGDNFCKPWMGPLQPLSTQERIPYDGIRRTCNSRPVIDETVANYG